MVECLRSAQLSVALDCCGIIMKRLLSSSSTFFGKFIFSAVLIMKFTAFFSPLIVFVSMALGQSSEPGAYPTRLFNHDGKFVTEHETTENTTLVSLEPVFIDHSETAKTSLRLAAGFQYEGTKPVKPKHISLAFYTLYPDCKFSFRPKLTMFVDGEVVQFDYALKSFRQRKPDEEGVAFSFSEMEGERCNELLAMFISRKNFLKVVNAKNVEVKVDAFRFKLTDANLEALRDLASRMVR
jgi:hypothetical protein